MKVHRLDEQTINQIAAGEIIERPASVVKELVENSIDAGATRIEIEIKNGGRQLIKIVDNGCGMEQEDAVLAIERHATSKITHANDLLDLHTLGFRGEALPSIASVSTFSLITKPASSAFGTMIESKGGILQKVKSIGAPEGTSISVQDLFFNTPARLKYLKSIPTESGYINEIVTRLALSNPGISFQLKHQDYDMLFTPGNGRLEDAVIALFGTEIYREMIPISLEDRNFKITGFYGKPSIARTNRKYEIFYINGRHINSRILSSAVERAYHTLLPIARYPFVILFIEIPRDWVDVNVHPTKLEVRFANESDVYKAVYHVIHNSLKEHSLISEWINPDDTLSLSQTIPQPTAPTTPTANLGLNYQVYRDIHAVKQEVSSVQETAAPEESIQFVPTIPTVPNTPVISDVPPEKSYRNWYVYPKTVQNTYIIVQDEQGLLFIDQHAAHERILFERFFSKAQELLGTQALLIPETVTLSYTHYKIISERMSLFTDLGFELEAFGGKTLIIRGVPLTLANMNPTQIILDLLEEYANFKTFKSPSEIKEAFLITMACRTAVKAGDKLDVMECESLIKDLFRCENPYTCPHGRPTVFRMSYDELGKKFLRR